MSGYLATLDAKQARQIIQSALDGGTLTKTEMAHSLLRSNADDWLLVLGLTPQETEQACNLLAAIPGMVGREFGEQDGVMNFGETTDGGVSGRHLVVPLPNDFHVDLLVGFANALHLQFYHGFIDWIKLGSQSVCRDGLPYNSGSLSTRSPVIRVLRTDDEILAFANSDPAMADLRRYKPGILEKLIAGLKEATYERWVVVFSGLTENEAEDLGGRLPGEQYRTYTFQLPSGAWEIIAAVCPDLDAWVEGLPEIALYLRASLVFGNELRVISFDLATARRVTAEMAIEEKDRLVGDISAELQRVQMEAPWKGWIQAVTTDAGNAHSSSTAQLDALIARLPAQMKVADIVLWRTEMWNAAINGSEVFTDTIVDDELLDLISPQWWRPETEDAAITLGSFGEIDYQLTEYANAQPVACGEIILPLLCEINASLGAFPGAKAKPVERRGFTVGLLFTGAYNKDLGKLYELRRPILRFLAPVCLGDRLPAAYASLVAGLKFMNLPYIAKEPLRPPRPWRRRRERAKESTSAVHVIYLRRAQAAKESGDLNSTEHEMKRQFTCQWIVGGKLGFWRKQWYPSLGIHKPVHIAPFVKGPADKPFKAPGSKRIYKVAR